MKTLTVLVASAIFAALGAPALASDLMGQQVSFQIQTYDDPAQPVFQGQVHTATVVEGIEFGLGHEGAQNDVDVVPILVDVGPSRIELRYSIADPGDLWKADFNGYVIRFSGGCAKVLRGRIDPDFTNLPLDNKSLRVREDALWVDVSDQSYDRDSRIGIDLDLSDCPES